MALTWTENRLSPYSKSFMFPSFFHFFPFNKAILGFPKLGNPQATIDHHQFSEIPTCFSVFFLYLPVGASGLSPDDPLLVVAGWREAETILCNDRQDAASRQFGHLHQPILGDQRQVARQISWSQVICNNEMGFMSTWWNRFKHVSKQGFNRCAIIQSLDEKAWIYCSQKTTLNFVNMS